MASFEEAVLRTMVMKICSHVGYNAITPGTIDILVDVYRKTFIHLARHCKEVANNNRRVEPTFIDLFQAFDFVNIPLSEILEHAKNVRIPFEFKIETEPELKPSNRVQRDLLVDDLLEAERDQGRTADNDDGGENEAGSDEEDNNMTPLLKDIYNEISTQFPNPIAPIKADKVKIKREEKPVIPKLKITPLDPSIAEPPSFLPIIGGVKPEEQTSFASNVSLPTSSLSNEKPKRGRQKGTRLKLKSKIKTSASARATANASAKAIAKAKGKTNPKTKLKSKANTKLKIKTKGRQKKESQPSTAKASSPEPPVPSPSPEPSIPTPPPVQKSPSPLPVIPKIETLEDAPIEQPAQKQPHTKAKKKKKRSSNQFSIVTETVPAAAADAPEEQEYICPVCKGPDDGNVMLACDACEFWYHLRCTDLKRPPKDNEDWHCNKCSAPKEPARTTPKPSAAISKTAKTKSPSIRGRKKPTPSTGEPVKSTKTPDPVVHHTPTPPPPIPTVVSEPEQTRPTVICSSQDDLCPECQLPDDGTLMIQCDDPFCAKWFHGKCVNVLMEPSENESWFCKACVEKQQSAFQRRRRAI